MNQPAKIKENGVANQSVEAPADVGRVDEEAVAKLPDVAGGAAGPPQTFQLDAGPLHVTTTVRRKFVVNDENEASMPPDVRQAHERAMHGAKDPGLQKNEIKLSFQITGPRLTGRKTLGGAPRPAASDPAAIASTPASEIPRPAPIEPAGAELRIRLALIAGAIAAVGFAYWLLVRGR